MVRNEDTWMKGRELEGLAQKMEMGSDLGTPMEDIASA